MRFAYADEAAGPFARLTASALKGVDRDGKGMIQFNLMVRGRPLANGIEGAEAFFEFGREKIVRGFAALTTDEMHAAWGRVK